MLWVEYSRENPYIETMTQTQTSSEPTSGVVPQPDDFGRPRPDSAAHQPGQVLVPIRSLGVNHRGRIERHLLALDPHDRYLRFGYAANDEQIARYAQSLDFERDEIFGIYNRRLDLIAVAHLALMADAGEAKCAEFGVSVAKAARGRGYGARLFDRAAMHARNEGVSRMFIHALSENHAMLKIALNAGAKVLRDGAESEAHLELPPATLDTRLTELWSEQLAQTDYQIKARVKHFRDLIADVQAIGRGAPHAPMDPPTKAPPESVHPPS